MDFLFCKFLIRDYSESKIMLVSGEREIVNFYSVHVFFSFLKYESMSGFHSKGCLRLNEDNARMDIDFNHLIAHIPMPPLSRGKEK